jgi:hypothetical protein
MDLNLFCRWVKPDGGGMKINGQTSPHASMTIQQKQNTWLNTALPYLNMTMHGTVNMTKQSCTG